MIVTRYLTGFCKQRFYFIAMLMLLLSTPALALNPAVHLKDYNHAMWTSKDGAPAEITSMAQTTDGWLWLGTPTGLYRFDGVRFEPYIPPVGSNLLGSRISELNAQPNGDLWIGYIGGGLSVIRAGGKLEHLALQGKDGQVGATFTLAIDRDNSIWVATSRGLMHFSNGKWTRVGAESGIPGGKCLNVMVDQYGFLWASNGGHLYLLDKHSGSFHQVAIDGPSYSLIESPDGRLWSGDYHKFSLVPLPQTAAKLPRQPGFNQIEGHGAGIFDGDGNLWSLKCPHGVCLVASAGTLRRNNITPSLDATDRFDQPWQMTTLATNLLMEDRMGNIWVSTQAGIERFRNNKLLPARVPGSDGFFTIAADGKNGIWAVDTVSHDVWHVGADGVIENNSGHFGIVANGDGGTLLFGGPKGIERRDGKKTQFIPLPADADREMHAQTVAQLLDDGVGTWAAISGAGYVVWKGGAWHRLTEMNLPARIGYATTGGRGKIWFSSMDGELFAYGNGKAESFSQAEILDVGMITYIRAGSELIVAGEKGISILRDGHFHRLLADKPDVLKNVTGVVATADGDLWLNGGKGVVHVLKKDWFAEEAKPGTLLRYELIDGLDGYTGEATTGTRAPTAVISHDGQIWFETTGGIVRLDPKAIRRNAVAPSVEIESLNTAQQRYSAKNGLVLPPGTSDFRIEYTALSYAKPERVGFRYKLDGTDSGWQDAGTRRTAYFTNIAPGDYTFDVIACNEDGVWTRSPATLRFRIEPTMVQTWWFKAVCVFAALVILWMLYLLRLRQITRDFQSRLGERLAERERIARDLHDTLLQSVQGLVLQVHAANQTLPAKGRERIEAALLRADSVIEESRLKVLDLRDHSNIVGLHVALAEAGRELASQSQVTSHPARFAMQVDGEARRLHPIVHEELYAIAREALTNAFRHAQTSDINLIITFKSTELHLSVKDNGKGIPGEVLDAGGRSGHWGIAGMRERALNIGAKFDLQSVTGEGTECVISIPASKAYLLRRKWLLFFR